MTNLPEAEVIRKSLAWVVDKRFKDIDIKAAGTVRRHRNRPDFVQRIADRKIVAIGRRGTELLLELDDDAVLVVMLGSETSITRETANEPAGAHTQAVFTFRTGGGLHVRDPAGEVELYVTPADELGQGPPGIDPLAGTFTWQAFGHQLLTRAQPLVVLLRDDSFILGLGDMYADEILWTAGLAGARGSATLSSQEIRRLYRAVFEVLYEAVKQGGSGEDFDLDAFEDSSESAEYLHVYGRQGQPCPRCRRPITLDKVVDRIETYHCESCQT